jgi:hypothetical protein
MASRPFGSISRGLGLGRLVSAAVSMACVVIIVVPEIAAARALLDRVIQAISFGV